MKDIDETFKSSSRDSLLSDWAQTKVKVLIAPAVILSNTIASWAVHLSRNHLGEMQIDAGNHLDWCRRPRQGFVASPASAAINCRGAGR